MTQALPLGSDPVDYACRPAVWTLTATAASAITRLRCDIDALPALIKEARLLASGLGDGPDRDTDALSALREIRDYLRQVVDLADSARAEAEEAIKRGEL